QYPHSVYLTDPPTPSIYTLSLHDALPISVSRVTTNKYIGTPRGVFELKYFFSTALTAEDGTAHSSESVKARIKTLIENESPKKRSEEHTSELQSRENLVCRLLREKKKNAQ